MKKFIIATIVLTSISYAFWWCIPYSCDPSISYAMSKQRDAITNRFNDLKNTIDALNTEEKRHTLYLTKESIEAMRLRARIKIETYLLMKNNYLLDTADLPKN
jgi:mevalonate pyrophosphate decarboxylase